MAKMIATIIERNRRDPRDGIATANGVAVEATDLPALAGSPKQAAWAADIRDGAVQMIKEDLYKMVLRATNNGRASFADMDRVGADLQRWADNNAARLEKLTEARWWIDNRRALEDVGARDLIKRAAAKVKA